MSIRLPNPKPNPKPLTKLQALDHCLKHWQYLAETGVRNKYEYFHEFEIDPEPMFSCYACQYDDDVQRKKQRKTSQHVIACTYCPLGGYAWREKKPEDDEDCPCIYDVDSLYTRWSRLRDPENRSRAAQAMVEAIKNAIKDVT